MSSKEAERCAVRYFEELGDDIPTVSGLALAIGLESRTELLNYDKGGKLEKVIKNALLRLESILEARLYVKETYNGAKTVLQSNFGWQDNPDNAKNQALSEVRKLLEGVGE